MANVQDILTSTTTLNNGVKMPWVGLGTYQTKGNETFKMVLHALNMGYKAIDTASLYANEADIGKAIQQSKIKREDVFITSKVAPWEQGYQATHDAFRRTTTLLGVDYLDLYIIHWPGSSKYASQSKENAALRKQTWLALQELYKSGKCRAIGVSNFLERHLEELINDPDVSVVPAVNQVECHPRLTQESLRKYCQQKGIQFEAYSSLAEGDLLNHKTVLEIAKAKNRSAAQVLLRWGLQHKCVIIPKSVNEQRIRENAELDFELSNQEMELLDGMNDGYHVCWDPEEIL